MVESSRESRPTASGRPQAQTTLPPSPSCEPHFDDPLVALDEGLVREMVAIEQAHSRVDALGECGGLSLSVKLFPRDVILSHIDPSRFILKGLTVWMPLHPDPAWRDAHSDALGAILEAPKSTHPTPLPGAAALKLAPVPAQIALGFLRVANDLANRTVDASELNL